MIVVFSSCTNEVREVRKFKTVMIKATGEDEIVPDVAKFQIRLECLRSKVSDSRECLVKQSNDLEAKLKSFGIDENDLLTTNVDLQKRYTWRNNSQFFLGYAATTNLLVTVRDLDNMDKIYTDLIDDQNIDISGLTYEHSKIDSLRNEVYVQAMNNANLLVEKLLEKLPEDHYEIVQVGNTQLQSSSADRIYGSRDMEMNVMAEEVQYESKNISISRGTLPVKATIFVEYSID